MLLRNLVCVAVIGLLAFPAYSDSDGKFGCGSERTDFFDHPELSFIQLSAPEAIREWQTRSVLTFNGIDQARYGFSQVQFYRWHVPVPGREGMDQGFHHDSTDRLALAVRLIGAQGERWFELGKVSGSQREEMLYIQPDAGEQSDAGGDPATATDNSPKAKKEPINKMEKWLTLQPATPDAALPLFVLRYAYNESGANAAGTVANELLLDLRSGAPQFVKAVQCINWEGGGACTAPDTSNGTYDHLQCQWEQTAGDFRCKMTSGFGAVDYPVRTAEKHFYLVSNKPAKPDWYSPDVPPDLSALALRIHNNPKMPAQRVLVPGLGPTIMLARYSDLLPNSDVMIFASPGPGAMYDARLFLVSAPAAVQGSTASQPTVQPIPKWSIGSDEAEDATASPDYTPAGAPDKYTVSTLEQRPGFRALQAVLIIPGQAKNPSRHVVYWIGVEAANGNLVANAVRLASETTEYAHCDQNLHDGTATSIQSKKGAAEATIRVQPKELSIDSGEKPPCAWSGVLHWTSGAGFRVRKTDEDCESAGLSVSITDNGVVSARPQKKEN